MIMRRIRRAYRVLLDVLFPPTCAACGAYSRSSICSGCEAQLQPIGSTTCLRCGKPTLRQVQVCRECRGRSFRFQAAAALWDYSGAARQVVKSVKYSNRRLLAGEIASRMKPLYSSLGECDVVTWVPMSKYKERRRGYNQSELLARSLGDELGLVARPLLRKTRHTRDQNRLSGKERRKNNEGAFTGVELSSVAGKRVLLVDDIYTTGSTVADCAAALRKAGVAAVYVITAARTVKEA